jgi:hypothetical protein
VRGSKDDHLVVRLIPIVDFFNWTGIDFLSERVGNNQHSLEWGLAAPSAVGSLSDSGASGSHLVRTFKRAPQVRGVDQIPVPPLN